MLLSFLPRLYPGELLYSWVARYHTHSGNTSIKNTTHDLFGNYSHISTPDLPCELHNLHKRVIHFSPPDPMEWITKHTLYNYYTAFLPRQIKTTVINAMLEGTHNALHMKTGIMASTIRDIRFFRYCPQCVSEDISLYGEPYLHTSHQLPSCFICPYHQEILCHSDIPYRGYNKHEYTPLTEANCTGTRVLEKIDERIFNTLLIIAKESNNLNKLGFQYGPEEVQQKYKLLLGNQGLLSSKGNVRQQELSSMFYDFYGGEVLNILQSSTNIDSQTCWLKTITRKHRKAFHPIRHILLTLYLGESLSSLKTISHKNIIGPFGRGPFPCLNKASSHYKIDIITNVNISISSSKLLIGTFECDCGFIYTRKGPDPAGNERYNISRVKKFGEIWLSKLQKLVNEKRYSFREIARILNTDTNTVIKYSNSVSTLPKPNYNSSNINYRQHWLLLQQQNPTLTKSELRKINPKIFTWLYRNDKDWLDINSPKLKRGGSSHSRVNWKERDNELSLEIIAIIVEFLCQSKPIRLTKSAIGKRLNKLSLLERNIHKLPKVHFILSEVTETIEDFQMRRVIWAAKQLRFEEEQIKAWKIKKLAGLGGNLSPIIERIIQATLLDP